MNEKRKIRKLAKKTLKDKWYKILKNYSNDFYYKDQDIYKSCSFCIDVIENGKNWDSKSKCEMCDINKYKDLICNRIDIRMSEETVKSIVTALEILAKKGEL